MNTRPQAFIADIAEKEIGVIETTPNRGPGIEKYWASTTFPEGYSLRDPWCAAFVSWCVEQAALRGKVSNRHLPRTARAWDMDEKFGALFASVLKGEAIPLHAQRGDIAVYTFSHTGIITGPAIEKEGVWGIPTVEGNTSPKNGTGASQREGDGVYAKWRPLREFRSVVQVPALATLASAA